MIAQTPKEALSSEIRHELLKSNGLTFREIATKVGTSKSTVALESKQLETEKLGYEEKSVTSLSPKLINKLAEKLIDENPNMARELTDLSKGIDSLDKLQPKLHDAVAKVIDRCTAKMDDEDIKPSEFNMYAELILKSYATVNHKGPVTQVNVQQNSNTVTIEALKAERDRLIENDRMGLS